MKKLLIYSIIFTALMAFSLSYSEALSPNLIQSSLMQMYQKYQISSHGHLASYIPELAKVDPHLFAIVVMTVNGKIYSVGDAQTLFPLESVSKPFVYALALIDNGGAVINKKISLNATGHAFNSIEAIAENTTHLQNPLVNAGAIMITSLIKGENSADKWQHVMTFFQNLSNSKPFLGESVYQSEMATNQRNQAIAMLLNSYDLLTDPLDAVDRYTKACSVMVNAKQLAVMAATLANKGVNPISNQAVIPPEYVRDVLSQMVVSGLYENSGIWWSSVGLPAKSGVSGVIIAIVPGKMAIVVYSPLVDDAGNSVRAQEVIQELSKLWHLHLLE